MAGKTNGAAYPDTIRGDLQQAYDRWNRFWFTPLDPTTLGFMRIITGLLVLYVHLAYCFDLTEFFGKDAWYPQDLANKVRQEAPIPPRPTTWDEVVVTPYPFPADPAARIGLRDLCINLPNTPHERLQRLTAVWMTTRLNTDRADLVVMLNDMASDRNAREVLMKELLESKKDFDPRPFPTIDLLRKNIEGLIEALPRDANARKATLEHLLTMTGPQRQLFEQFVATSLPNDPAARRAYMEYYEEWNFDPNKAHAKNTPVWSVWFHVSDPTAMRLIHGGFLVVMVLFTLGLFTRITSVLTWLAAISFINRADLVLYGQDTMMNLLLIYLMIGPSGAALSLDRLIARFRIIRAAQRAGKSLTDPEVAAALAGPKPLVSANVITRMLMIHFCFIYMASGLSKLKGTTWWTHNATWYTLVNPEFSPINFSFYESLMRWIASQRPVYEIFMSLSVAYTLVLEIALPFLVWNVRWRPWMILGGCLLHTGISACMGLSVFSLLMMTLLLAYFPPLIVRERLASGNAGLPRLRLTYDRRDPQQLRRVARWRALDVADQIEFFEATPADQDAPTVPLTLVVNGQTVSGPAVTKQLMRSLRLTRSFAWLTYLPGFGGASDTKPANKLPIESDRLAATRTEQPAASAK
jgi:hypothetical protein